ncbi:MAG TPA: Rrf2 family transcriptional regulator, partial [Candidatus Krumholzibacterium sp.]|nr:Rrf2 family transcriptional regulator [Candidatus Krumholzibacterium sp.]
MIIVGQSSGNGPVSTRTISETGGIPYQLACKIMQQLHKAGLVKSRMGPAGGFMLGAESSTISLQDIVEAIQGAVSLNRCIGEIDFCDHRPTCAVTGKLEELQGRINEFL